MYLSVHISTIYNSQDVEATQAFERVKGRKARGLQAEEIGRKCQTFFLSPLSGGRKQTTSVRFFFLLHTKLKGAFSMEMFFLSYVNESMYLLWNLSFFKMVPPKTNFFFFLKPWADNSSTNQYSHQLFYGWEMTHLEPSYLKNAYCGRGAW